MAARTFPSHFAFSHPQQVAESETSMSSCLPMLSYRRLLAMMNTKHVHEQHHKADYKVQ
jgi:hypothetical protein